MKKYFSVVFWLFIFKGVDAQPWKIKEQFKEAFYYDTSLLYHLTHQRGKCHIEVFTKADSSIKLFKFEVRESDHKKDGVFKAYYKDGGIFYTLLFKNGIAKHMTIDLPDSTLGRYTLDNFFFNGVHTAYYKNGNIKEYGYYKDNARVGDWIFYNSAGKVIKEGNYFGDYNKVLLDVKQKQIITLNRYLDTIKVAELTQETYDSLKQVLKQDWGLAFPVHLYFEHGNWKYYDDTGRLIKEEFYEKGKLISTITR